MLTGTLLRMAPIHRRQSIPVRITRKQSLLTLLSYIARRDNKSACELAAFIARMVLSWKAMAAAGCRMVRNEVYVQGELETWGGGADNQVSG